MRVRTKRKKRIFSAAVLREGEGVVPRDQESGRSQLLPEAGSAVRGVAEEQAGPQPVGSAALCREQCPADWVPGARLVARLGARLEARHRPLEVVESGRSSADRARSPGPP